MNFKSILIVASLLLFCYVNAHSQYGKLSCYKCTDEDLADVRRGLAKKNRVDTIRSYHLLASYLYSKEKLDSAQYYLDTIHQMDSSYISKKYALLSQVKLNNKKSKYFLFDADESFSSAYINDEIIETFLKSAKEAEKELDDFSIKLDKLDQQYRTEWINALTEKEAILDDFKRSDFSYKKIKHLEDSLTFLQLVNDSLSIDFVLKNFETMPEYFKTNFNSSINAFFLHSVKRIHKIKPLLNYMLENKNLSVGNYSIYIDRYYCTKYDKAAFGSTHCEKDELLQHLASIEFPVFYNAYENEVELDEH